jgi:putative NADH-flavin reductase
MNIAIIGATGRGGQRLVNEALSRGHSVTAISRRADGIAARPGLTGVACDIADSDALARAIAGHDAVILAWRPAPGTPAIEALIRDGFNALLTALRQAGVERLLVMGGAGTLEVAPGVKNIDRPEFPEAWKAGSRAGSQKLDILKGIDDLQWSYLSPAHEIFEGERTGSFRLGGDRMIVDAEGNSRISFEDYAVAMIDELEEPQNIGRRFTLGY